MVNDFRVELFIDNGDEENIKLTSLNEKDMERWKRNLEEQALCEYYNRKIKISSQKI
ncbi:MAG: hypothetical protein J1F01_07685 [Oscillospiraceae bacterium]|nr:hypothetical protein [Oscillospiraceae bacterium]